MLNRGWTMCVAVLQVMAVVGCTAVGRGGRESVADSSDTKHGHTLSLLIQGKLIGVEVLDPKARRITREKSEIPGGEMYDYTEYTVVRTSAVAMDIESPVEGQYLVRAIAQDSTWCDMNASGFIDATRRCEADTLFTVAKGQELEVKLRYDGQGADSCAVAFVQGEKGDPGVRAEPR